MKNNHANTILNQDKKDALNLIFAEIGETIEGPQSVKSKLLNMLDAITGKMFCNLQIDNDFLENKESIEQLIWLKELIKLC